MCSEYIKFSFETFESLLEEETKDISDPKQVLRKINELLVDAVLSYNPRVVTDLKEYYSELHEIRIKFNKKWAEYMSRIIEEGKKAGDFRSDINPDLVSRLFIREMESLWGRMQIKSREDLKIEQGVIYDVLINGISI